jgi:pimeloyl-ACP methyl ester carboxylesterase
MANDTLALVNNLHWTSYHLIGLSMGGMIALELALIDYDRILSLTLMVTHAGGPSAYVPVSVIFYCLYANYLSNY